MERSSKRGKIPQSDWPSIMARYEAGETLSSIARTYDCSPPAISFVVSRSRRGQTAVTARHGLTLDRNINPPRRSRSISGPRPLPINPRTTNPRRRTTPMAVIPAMAVARNRMARRARKTAPLSIASCAPASRPTSPRSSRLSMQPWPKIHRAVASVCARRPTGCCAPALAPASSWSGSKRGCRYRRAIPVVRTNRPGGNVRVRVPAK